MFLRLDVPRVRIDEGEIFTEALIAPLPAWIANPSGMLAASAIVAVTDPPEQRAWLEIEEGAIELAGIGLSGISIRQSFEALWPPVTRPGQKLRIQRIDLGLSLGPFEAMFALKAGLPSTFAGQTWS